MTPKSPFFLTFCQKLYITHATKGKTVMFTKSQVTSLLVIFIGENREDILNEVKKKKKL